MSVSVAVVLIRVSLYVVKIITDIAISVDAGNAQISDLWFWCLLFPVLYIVNESIWRCSGVCGMKLITGVESNAYETLFAYLTGHSSNYFNDRYAGALTNKISNAAKGCHEIFAKTLWQFYPTIIGFCSDLYLANQVHEYFTYVVFCWVIFYLVINILLISKLNILAFTLAESASLLKGKIVDSTANIETVKHSGEIEYEERYINRFISKLRKDHLREWTASEWVLVYNSTLMAIFMAVMFALGAYLIEHRAISVGSFVMIITVVLGLERNLFFIGQQMTQAVGYYGQISEGLNELLKPHEVVNSPNPLKPDETKGEIIFNNVTFNYQENGVFQDFNLQIGAAEKIGLIGPSGAGKSTLISLLLRHFDVMAGSISIDGVNITELELNYLRKSIAVVPQTTSLFHRSIMENIRYGRLDATDEEVMNCAKLAEADKFINALPKGYETLVGERGVKLSGGQRQRISIARAILKNAPILILDEATSALDSESEGAIQGALIKLIEGKTVIAIAHRLSTLQLMDRLVVIEDGEIVEDGTHKQLLGNNGLYARLWNNQVRGFIQE